MVVITFMVFITFMGDTGLFTSFVGRREFALSVVETTCFEETLFKVVRACMRKTVE